MAEVTKISWAHSTFNPWIGCTKIGPGCDNCYAEVRDRRHLLGGVSHWGPGVPRHLTSKAYWREPLKWNEKAARGGQPWRVFCASHADVFDNEVDPEWRAALFRLIKATPHLTWLLLTKRIGNVADMLPTDWGEGGREGYANVWLGITVVTQDEAKRDISKLVKIPARVHWLSIEPQLERMSMAVIGDRASIDWIVCGGESGPHSRPFDIDWARQLRKQCRSYNIKFFMKQLGTRAVNRGELYEHTGKGDDPSEWPVDLQVQEFPA